LYRPFSIRDFIGAIPKTAKVVTALDRTKEPGSLGEPLYLDICAALAEAGITGVKVLSGRYGLSSKEFTPSMINAVFKNAEKSKKNHFTVGINDDVTHTSLTYSDEFISASPAGTVRCKFYGIGADGTVGANKNSIKIIGDHTEKYAQGYFVYDSKKSGGITISHLRFGDSPIKSTYLIDQADFVACHNPSYVTRYNMLGDLKEGGIFLLNCPWPASELDAMLTADMKRQIAAKRARFYIIDARKISGEAGLGNRINVAMQAVFFKLADIIPYANAERFMKEAAKKTYGKKGDEVVAANYRAIDNAIAGMTEVKYPASWKDATDGALPVAMKPDKYFQNFIHTVLSQNGDALPVSAFNADGSVPTGTTKFEKRGIAVTVPDWIPENCIQCNQCAYVCPHAVIRPVLAAPASVADAPAGFATLEATGAKQFRYRMQVSPLDCTGCGSCANVCPSKKKALVMADFEHMCKKEEANFEYSIKLPVVESPFNKNTVKGSQFLPPLFEYSGACTGCGETPYIKLITQLFGDRMLIGNATGCTSIYGGSAPTCPYTVNEKGHGPAWANSLFEDNAEFGYGMNLAYTFRRNKIADDAKRIIELAPGTEFAATLKGWLEAKDDGELSKGASQAVKDGIARAYAAASGELKDLIGAVKAAEDCLIKKSIWIIGGDGWAYDIGYGGLDHVLAAGEDVNILVLDTEVYSNTGGQSSKATPTGSVAKFATAGKRTKKKDLGMMAMSYGYVYVAQVAMGASQSQLLKALIEAESYKGPSVIIAYSTCINHGIDMSNGQQITRDAVDAGYWQLYRYNPLLADEGKNPFTLDSKDPTASYQDFIARETRYTSLKKTSPDIAAALFAQAEKDAQERLAAYKALANK
ncbi:MAG: pyruvate:ferredoxin (flavodoxin) oxidoreductase, partial [Firmicutes bacterium]|nr:pyruvate:ferredoxin (flavodoxin) oxidoreductase [Bacillota bacterium]